MKIRHYFFIDFISGLYYIEDTPFQPSEFVR